MQSRIIERFMNSILHKTLFVKKAIAVFLLMVFTLGITPKKALHNLLANHTDNTFKTSDSKSQQLSVAGFNCKCDDLVAESNFIAVTNTTYIVSAVWHSEYTLYYSSLTSLPHLSCNLRGPPVNA